MFEKVFQGVFRDPRGALHVLERPESLPFEPKRVFWVSGVPQGEIRGFHAHRTGHQVLFCMNGSIELTLRRPEGCETIILSDQGPGVWLREMTWGEQKFLSHGAILLVVASNCYDERDYIRDFELFKNLLEEGL